MHRSLTHSLATLIGILGLNVMATGAEPAPAAPVALSYEMLAKLDYKDDVPPVFPEELKKLEGKRVAISGFCLPYDDMERMWKFLMMEVSMECFYCSPPGVGVLFVRLSLKENAPEMTAEKVSVQGIFHLRNPASKDEEANQFLFTIDEAKIVK
jgi:hypothetical protein